MRYYNQSMKIVFIAPATAKNEKPVYKKIVSLCKKNDHSVQEYYKILPEKSLRDRAQTIADAIKKAECVICEVSTITVETSRFISLALQFHIPTLFLYKEENNEMQAFEISRFLTMKKYDDATLDVRLKEYFKQIQKQRLLYRFNLMLSHELGQYVLDKSEGKRISKADYIRQLIIRDMNE